MTLPTGRYRLECRTLRESAVFATAVVEHVGVGEVFVTCGQSNSANYGQPRQQALQLAGPRGVRAVLWHQGESDSLAGTAAADYARRLGECIARSRQDAGWDVPWGVATASFHPDAKATADRQAAVIAGQQTVIQTVPGVFAGPATDGYRDRGCLCDGVHFNGAGLAAHAAGWAVAVDPLLRAASAGRLP